MKGEWKGKKRTNKKSLQYCCCCCCTRNAEILILYVWCGAMPCSEWVRDHRKGERSHFALCSRCVRACVSMYIVTDRVWMWWCIVGLLLLLLKAVCLVLNRLLAVVAARACHTNIWLLLLLWFWLLFFFRFFFFFFCHSSDYQPRWSLCVRVRARVLLSTAAMPATTRDANMCAQQVSIYIMHACIRPILPTNCDWCALIDLETPEMINIAKICPAKWGGHMHDYNHQQQQPASQRWLWSAPLTPVENVSIYIYRVFILLLFVGVLFG